MNYFSRLKKERAASLTGYGLIVGLIAVVAIAAISNVGSSVSTLFGKVANDMETVSNGSANSGGSGSTGSSGDPCASSPAIGALCDDGTIYAGLTPDGNVPLYVRACDLGMDSYNEVAGTCDSGTRSKIPWNNGNSGNRVLTTAIAENDGDGNTAILLTTDSDSGTAGVQPHQAAEACNALGAGWYLPASAEMQVIYTNLGAPGAPLRATFHTSTGYPDEVYWTSRDNAESSAWVGRFNSGNVTNGNFFKQTGFNVRCVRQ